ncbi:hypothetical protein [Paractinoplanes durhamensis]
MDDGGLRRGGRAAAPRCPGADQLGLQRNAAGQDRQRPGDGDERFIRE